METRFLGEEVKIKVWVTPVDGMTLADFNWRVKLWTRRSRAVEVWKAECIPQDDKSYIVRLDTAEVGPGVLKLKAIADVPDGDFIDGDRKAIGYIEVIKILRGYAE